MIARVSKGQPLWRVIDPIVLSSGVTRVVSSITGPATALLILHFLSLVEQGYWYTFVGLIAVVNYAELGMGQVILQFAAYERGRLPQADGSLDTHHELRLKSIFRTALIVGSLTGLIEVAVALPLGYFILTRHQVAAGDVQWLGPWVLAAIVAPLNILLAFVNAFLEGCQMIIAANLRRALQAIVQVATFAMVFACGGRLWALGAGQLAAFVTGGVLIWLAQGSFIRQMSGGFLRNCAVSWREEIWPLQWRYAAGWATGPLTFGLLNPLIFTLVGAEDAGRFGFTFAVVGVIAAYSQVWTAARAAVFTNLNAAAKWRELKSLFERSVKLAAATYLLGAVAMMAALLLINAKFPALAERFLDPLSTLLLLAASGIVLLFFSITYFVRSFKEEPFVKMAWINAALTVVLVPAGVWLFRTLGAAAAYLVVQAAVFPLALQIYHRYNRRIEIARGQESL